MSDRSPVGAMASIADSGVMTNRDLVVPTVAAVIVVIVAWLAAERLRRELRERRAPGYLGRVLRVATMIVAFGAALHLLGPIPVTLGRVVDVAAGLSAAAAGVAVGIPFGRRLVTFWRRFASDFAFVSPRRGKGAPTTTELVNAIRVES